MLQEFGDRAGVEGLEDLLGFGMDGLEDDGEELKWSLDNDGEYIVVYLARTVFTIDFPNLYQRQNTMQNSRQIPALKQPSAPRAIAVLVASKLSSQLSRFGM